MTDYHKYKIIETQKEGIQQVGKLIIQSEENVVNKLEFVIDNFSDENRELLKAAIQLRQSDDRLQTDKIINDILYEVSPSLNTLEQNTQQRYSDITVRQPGEPKPKVMTLDNATLMDLEEISKKYKVLLVEMNKDQSYVIKYRELTNTEQTQIQLNKN